jgi:hypothetical protein
MRTIERPLAESRTSARFLRCALNVDRLARIDCSSPMSAKILSTIATLDPAATGAGTPDCTSAEKRPSALSRTVFPPVFGPETSSVLSLADISRSNGTTSTP